MGRTAQLTKQPLSYCRFWYSIKHEMGVSLFHFADWKLQPIGRFFVSHSVVPTAGDMATALLRAMWQLAEGVCCCWSLLHMSPESPMVPGPGTCRMLPISPWAALWPCHGALGLSHHYIGSSQFHWVGAPGRLQLSELLQNSVTILDGCWRMTGRTTCSCARKSHTEGGFNSHFWLNYVSMEEFLCVLKCPQGGKEHTEAVSVSYKALGSIVIE